MNKIEVGKYDNPEKIGWLGWISSKEFCLFVDMENNVCDIDGCLIKGKV